MTVQTDPSADPVIAAPAPAEIAPAAPEAIVAEAILAEANEVNEPPEAPAAVVDAAVKPGRRQSVLPVLEKLFELYPKLFGAEFLPLKLGIFQELLASHPDQLERACLKVALGVHTRSTQYLQGVAAGKPRYNLQGEPVEPVSPEHVHLALLELFRRRQGRSAEDLRPKLRRQLMGAFEASGLSRQDYLARVHGNDADANTLLEEAFAERDQRLAREEALRRAFSSSGKTVAEFAAMYGLDPRDAKRALQETR
ncbi:MAG: ProQ/FINO family protein [Rhodoferax sp.]